MSVKTRAGDRMTMFIFFTDKPNSTSIFGISSHNNKYTGFKHTL